MWNLIVRQKYTNVSDKPAASIIVILLRLLILLLLIIIIIIIIITVIYNNNNNTPIIFYLDNGGIRLLGNVRKSVPHYKSSQLEGK
jgi:hypothetical protein